MTLRIFASIFSMVFMGILAWVAGYNFDTRGIWEAFYFAMTIVFGLLIFLCPVFE